MEHWFTLASEIRPFINQIEGLDGEHLDYLVGAVDRRHGADIDEYRALYTYAKEARKLRMQASCGHGPGFECFDCTL